MQRISNEETNLPNKMFLTVVRKYSYYFLPRFYYRLPKKQFYGTFNSFKISSQGPITMLQISVVCHVYGSM